MHKININKYKPKKTIAAITLLALLTNCTTTKHRDQQLVKTLHLQNETISTLTNHRAKVLKKSRTDLSEADKKNEQELLKALTAIKESNKVVINKLKPKRKKECNCGKDEGTND